MPGRLVTILLVEDNPGDARLTQEALKEGKSRVKVHHVRDGVDELAFLQKKEQYILTHLGLTSSCSISLPISDHVT